VDPKTTWAVVLAGGDGTRLGNVTRIHNGVPFPKQFCSLSGGPTLLQRTLKRAERMVPTERILPVVNAHHRQWWSEDLDHIPPSNIIVQPTNRGTAVGLLLPLLEILDRDGLATILVLPSDHFVSDEVVLETAMRQALAGLDAEPGAIVALGITPDARDADYGWLVPGPNRTEGVHEVSFFVEKPPAEQARQLRDLGALWSSFIFAARADRLLALYEQLDPRLVWSVRAARWSASGAPTASMAKTFDHLASADFSRDILQRVPTHLLVCRVPPCGWCDLGTPDRVARLCKAHGPATTIGDTPRRPILSVLVRDHLAQAGGH